MTSLTSTVTGVTQHSVCIIWSCIIHTVHLLTSYKLLLCPNPIVSCPGNAINSANGHCILPLKCVAYNAWGLPDASARVWTNAPYKYPSSCSLVGWPWWRWNCCKFSWVMEHLLIQYGPGVKCISAFEWLPCKISLLTTQAVRASLVSQTYSGKVRRLDIMSNGIKNSPARYLFLNSPTLYYKIFQCTQYSNNLPIQTKSTHTHDQFVCVLKTACKSTHFYSIHIH